MPQRENNGDRFERLRHAAQRREFMATVLAASVGAMAGCPSGDGDGDTDTPDESGDDPTATATDTPTEGSTGGGDTDTPDQDTPTSTPPQSPPEREILRHYMATNPSQSNINYHMDNIQNQGYAWMHEIIRPFLQGQSRFYLNGHTWDIPGVGEVEVSTWLDDYTIEPPYDWWENYNQETTYWDGTAMNADAQLYDEQVSYYAEGQAGFDDSVPTFEKSGEWEFHSWQEKGQGGNQDLPANRYSLESNVGRYDPPLHPDLQEGWAQTAMDADTEDEATAIWEEDIRQRTITYTEMASEGWGSGLYMFEESDVSDQGITMHAREDHGNYRDETIEEIFLRVADVQVQNTFLNQGQIDIDAPLIVEESSGAVNRQTLPGRVQQLATFPGTAMFGYPFNWRDELGDLWFRRAMIEAIDWVEIAENAHGPNSFYLTQHHTGLFDPMAERWFSEDFLDSLISWSAESNMDRADQFLENSGYSRQGGSIVKPSGEEADLELMTSPGHALHYQLSLNQLNSQLNDWGVNAEFRSLSIQAANTARDNMSYDIAFWWNNMTNPWGAYTASNGNWNPKIVERDPAFPDSEDLWTDAMGGRTPDPETTRDDEGNIVQRHNTEDLRNMPLEIQLPSEVGNMDAPDEAGRNPDLSGAGIEADDLDLVDLLYEFHTTPSLPADRIQELMRTFAWFYNYFMPDFWAVQVADGVVGNVRDFNFTENDHRNYAVATKTGGHSDTYQVHSGLVRKKYDDDFDAP